MIKRLTLLVATFVFTAGIFAQTQLPATKISDVLIKKEILSPQEAEDCSQQAEDFAYVLGSLDVAIFADDLEVSENTVFSLDTIILYYGMGPDGDFSEIEFTAYEDEGGAPGDEIDDIEVNIIYEIIQPDALPGTDLGVMLIAFDTPLELEGGEEGANYWFGITAQNDGDAGLVTSNVQAFGNEFMVGIQGEWMAGSAAFDFEGDVFDLAFDYFGTCEEKQTTGVSDGMLEEINVFPNPAQSLIHIDAEGEGKTLSIVSALGQEVLNAPVNGMTSVSLESLSDGIYIYTIRDNKNEVIKSSKLIIRK